MHRALIRYRVLLAGLDRLLTFERVSFVRHQMGLARFQVINCFALRLFFFVLVRRWRERLGGGGALVIW